MITTYTFSKKNSGNIPFHSNTVPNYSKIIDDGIILSLIKKNSYLFKSKNDDAEIFLDNISNSDFAKATKFLANYKKNKSYKLPYIFGKMYTLNDGTPIVFYDDEIQIGFDTYSYADFNNISFLNTLPIDKKKIIINIYTAGEADININLI